MSDAAASTRRDGAASVGLAASDPQAFLAALIEGAARALTEPRAAAVLTVERSRTLGDRLAGRPGTITELRLTSGPQLMSLRPAAHSQWIAETHRVSGGVVIARSTQSLGEWLTAFAGRIAALAADAAGDAAASSRALQLLGIHSPDAGVAVNDQTLDADLRSLPGRVAGRVPADALAEVERIATLLLDAAHRVHSGAEADQIVRRAAVVYLPDTLRAYLALPPDWTASHTFADGSTPDSALIAQLGVLRAAVEKLRDSAVANDANALLVNGRFLADRFAVSSLDLS